MTMPPVKTKIENEISRDKKSFWMKTEGFREFTKKIPKIR